jgi:hypothetical protein
MNKHIELVKKWLDDPSTVSTEELEDSTKATYAAYAASGKALYAAVYKPEDAAAYAAAAAYWVEEYEELTQ